MDRGHQGLFQEPAGSAFPLGRGWPALVDVDPRYHTGGDRRGSPLKTDREKPPDAFLGGDVPGGRVPGDDGRRAVGKEGQGFQRAPRGGRRPVSYTHLTLPTIYSV